MATTPIALFSPSLVGDVIVQARETVPDMPPSMVTPILTSLTAVNVAGGAIAAGTYFIVVTAFNQWGESLPSNELNVVVGGANNAIQIVWAAPAGTTGIKVYSAGAATEEQGYNIITPFPGATFNFLTFTGQTPGPPPTRSTAWYPDSDGGFISAAAIFRWLNAGLELIARGTGGYQDYSAIGSTINQPLYQIPGIWNTINSIWYDGYWMQGGDPGYYWRRNSITSQVLSSAHISVQNSGTVLEVYPQPARTAQTTTLSSGMTSTATVANLTLCQFVLPFGFAWIGSEVVAYATINGNQITGLIRGLGGTSAIAHNAAETVVECNIAWMGKRQSSQTFTPGQSANTLPITSGWDQLLVQYIAGRAKIVEHDFQSMQAFNAEMEKAIKGWAQTTQGVVRRRQVGGPRGPIVYYGDQAGGILVNAWIPYTYMLSLYYYAAHGGTLPWQLSTFMFFETLGMVLYGTWGKRTALNCAQFTTTLRILCRRVSSARNGFRNFVHSIFAPVSKSLRNVARKIGKSGNVSGSSATVGSEICSMPIAAEPRILLVPRSNTNFCERNSLVLSAHLKPSRGSKIGNLLAGSRAMKLATNCEPQTKFSFLIPFLGRSTAKL